jgi:hypothetical protein
MWRSTLAINAKAEANMHSSLKINLEGAAVTGASNGAGRGPSPTSSFLLTKLFCINEIAFF